MLSDEFASSGKMKVVEHVAGAGLTDYCGLSFRSALAEHEPTSEAECGRKIALLRARWSYFDSVASGVPAELRKGREVVDGTGKRSCAT